MFISNIKITFIHAKKYRCHFCMPGENTLSTFLILNVFCCIFFLFLYSSLDQNSSYQMLAFCLSYFYRTLGYRICTNRFLFLAKLLNYLVKMQWFWISSLTIRLSEGSLAFVRFGDSNKLRGSQVYSLSFFFYKFVFNFRDAENTGIF